MNENQMNVRQSLAGGLLAVVMLGIAYPMLMTAAGQILFKAQASGSLLVVDGRIRGSTLVGQSFAAPEYLIGRPSAADYDPMSVGGSNLAPTNPELRAAIETTAAEIRRRDGIAGGGIPSDLVMASGAGIDPHVSPAGAAVQVPRIASIRGVSEDRVRAIVDANTQGPTLGIFGQPRVHVLNVNLALDREFGSATGD